MSEDIRNRYDKTKNIMSLRGSVKDIICICPNGVELYNNDIEMAIDYACQQYCIDDLVKASQRQWKAVMRYIGKSVFADRKMLKATELVKYNNNPFWCNNDKYDDEMLVILYNYYLDLSDRFNKLISAEAFSLFLGLNNVTVSEWSRFEPGQIRYEIFKNLKAGRFECIKDRAYDNPNVTGTMYVGNVEYQTNLPGVREDTSKRVLSVEELPKLGEVNNSMKALDVVSDVIPNTTPCATQKLQAENTT